jgi:ATP-dependent protease HslVU (ClpYQ) peptidase subunit
MTCVVGVVHQGDVYIGGDSASFSGLDMTHRRDPKVFRNGPFLIGFTSSFRMGQLLQYAFTPPVQGPEDVYKYMVTTFIDSVRDCFQAGGFAEKKSEREVAGVFLVGYRGRLFKIDSDYQVAESMDVMAAIGCGANVALGALFVLGDKSPKERILWALAAAERFNASVRGPFVLESLGGEIDL